MSDKGHTTLRGIPAAAKFVAASPAARAESPPEPKGAAPALRPNEEPRPMHSRTRPYFPSQRAVLDAASATGAPAEAGALPFAFLEGLFENDARALGLTRCTLGETPSFDPLLPSHLFSREDAALTAPRGERAHSLPAAPRRRDPELPDIGSIIDKYRVEELLGVGGFAVVYRATHLPLRMPVAIKMLRPRVLRSRPRLAESLCEEARFAAKISHPNVVRVFDVSHTPSITYVVMEYLDGSTLAKIIKSKGPQPFRTVINVGLDVAKGLRAGLEQGLCHRDIKPANIIITRAGITKIVDLGLARSSTLDARGTRAASESSIVGTYGYMAPERILAPATADFRGDIYALGVTLYHAAVGKPPFPSDDPERCLRMHCEDAVPLADMVRQGVPAALSDLLLWMLAKDPSDRPASYDALEDALRRVLQSLPDAEANQPGV